MHEFLVNEDGLNPPAKHVPAVREYINGLPETKSTFSWKEVERDLDITMARPGFNNLHIEFCGAWPLSGSPYNSGHFDRFANPNHVHKQRYSDVAVQCECGAWMTHNYDNEKPDNLDLEHDHTDDCKPFWRLAARSEVKRSRFHTIIRCAQIGWTSGDIGDRLGVSSNAVTTLLRDCHEGMREQRDVYRTKAAETYEYLVRDHGLPVNRVAEIYGHDGSTMTRWAQKYTGYETWRGANQFGRNEKGQFAWVNKE